MNNQRIPFTKMKAMEFTDKLNLQPVMRPVPEPQAGEILIQVSAVGVMPTEKLWSTTSHYEDGTVRSKAIPGHEFSGTVAGLGAGVTGYSLGDAVFGFNDWFAEGATAEFCITKPSNLSLKPSSLSHVGGSVHYSKRQALTHLASKPKQRERDQLRSTQMNRKVNFAKK